MDDQRDVENSTGTVPVHGIVSQPVVKVKPTLAEQGSGLTATISYTNDDFVLAMRKMFCCRPDERIVQVEFQDEFVTARLKRTL